MNLAVTTVRRRPWALAAAVAVVVFAPMAQAAEPLVWKFEPGLTNHYQMVQKMDMSMNLGAGGETSSSMVQTIDMSWTVEEVQDDDSAVLKQKIDRMRMKMTMPGDQGGSEFDSAAEKPPEGHAAMLAPLLKAMTADAFIVHMTPRGEITEVEVPEGMAKALEGMPGAALMGDMATPEGFKKMITQAAFTLPEKLEPGTEWSSKLEIKNPVTGPQVAETTYRYEGPKEVDGATMEVFTPSLNMTFGEGGAAKVEVSEQDSSGEILFNRDKGRLESSHMKQTMTMNIGAEGEGGVTMKMDQTIDMKWMPEEATDEKRDEATSPEEK